MPSISNTSNDYSATVLRAGGGSNGNGGSFSDAGNSGRRSTNRYNDSGTIGTATAINRQLGRSSGGSAADSANNGIAAATGSTGAARPVVRLEDLYAGGIMHDDANSLHITQASSLGGLILENERDWERAAYFLDQEEANKEEAGRHRRCLATVTSSTTRLREGVLRCNGGEEVILLESIETMEKKADDVLLLLQYSHIGWATAASLRQVVLDKIKRDTRSIETLCLMEEEAKKNEASSALEMPPNLDGRRGGDIFAGETETAGGMDTPLRGDGGESGKTHLRRADDPQEGQRKEDARRMEEEKHQEEVEAACCACMCGLIGMALLYFYILLPLFYFVSGKFEPYHK